MKKLKWLIYVFIVICGFWKGGVSQILPWGDEFEQNDLSEWTIIDDQPNTGGPSNWYILNGVLHQSVDIYVEQDRYDVFKGTHIIAGDETWKDYYIIARVGSSDDDGIGVLFRYQNENNYYRFITLKDVWNQGPFKRLQKQVNGSFETLAELNSDIKIPGEFVCKIRVKDDSIYVYEDEQLLFAVQDNTFLDGKIGLMCYDNNGAKFDDVYVSEQDTIYGEKPEPPIPYGGKFAIRTMTWNLWWGDLCTPTQVANLIQSLGLDFVGLQECSETYANRIGQLTGLTHLAKYKDCKLLSRTPFIFVEELPVIGVHAVTEIDSHIVSIYNFHIHWDEQGDREARIMVDSLFALDPVPIQIAIGDFNDEHYSTQINILEEHMRHCLSDLGWAPSQRVTWPAFEFYRGEGAQMIDLILCNKQSKGRMVEGDIINLSPILSDHKPVWGTIIFPDNAEELGPQLSRIIPYFSDNIIELWFDQDLDSTSIVNTSNYNFIPLDGGESVSIIDASPLKDKRRIRLQTTSHQFNKHYEIEVIGVTDEFGIPISQNNKLEYSVAKNLLANPGAEETMDSWESSGGFMTVSERENQFPYLGDAFFTGQDGQPLSTGSQTIDLEPWAEQIDARTIAAEWNCYFATGYEVLGELRASRCEPYDEGEMLIDFMDANGKILLQASSKRWDTLFWHPYGEITYIPAGTRKAKINLNSYRKTANGLSNDACFENAFFSLFNLDESHSSGSNLLRNPSAETGDMDGWTTNGTIRARSNEDNKARSVSGNYIFSNSGVAPSIASQEVDLSDFRNIISQGQLALKWGGYLRDFRGDSPAEIKLEFYGENNGYISEVSTGEQKIAEWWLFDKEKFVPREARSIKFIIKAEPMAEEGVYFDFLHLIPVFYLPTHVSENFLVTQDFELKQNYPNPFNALTSFNYFIPISCKVELVIYNMMGQQIVVLVSDRQAAGSYQYKWDGGGLASGVYIYRLTVGDFVQSKKLVILK